MPRFGQPFEFKGADDPLGKGDLMRHTMERKFIPILVLLNEAIPAAADRFKYFEAGLKAVRTEPLGINFSVRICLEDEFAWSIELSRDKEFLFARLSCDGGFIF